MKKKRSNKLRYKKRVRGSQVQQNMVIEAKAEVKKAAVQMKETESKVEEKKAEPKKVKLSSEGNVAFKCNYNEAEKNLFAACSDENIEITSNQWKCSAGNGGKAKTIKCAQSDSIAILTTRFAKAKEEERVIFGAFLIDEVFNGTDTEAGYVKTSSKYKLELTSEEAEKLLFWKYYHNEKSLTSTLWGSGLYRKVDDIKSAQILRAICEIKKGTAQEQLAKEFFEHFCHVHEINISEIPEPNGPLA